MIKELMIKNFQSHKLTDISFDPGINVIVGPSDSGKSAIIRAIQWLIYNRPLGDVIRSRWGGEVIVRLENERGYLLHSRAENGDSEYVVNDNVLRAFGTDVPEQIDKVIRLDETNLQRQFDTPFLLSDSPGEVARHYNKIAGLEQIDLGLKNVQRWIGQINSNIKFKQEQLDQLKKEYEKYKFLDKVEAELEVLSDLQNRLNKFRSDAKELSSLISELEDLEVEVVKLQDFCSLEPTVSELVDLVNKEEELNDLIEEYLSIQIRIEKDMDIVNLQSQVDLLFEYFEQSSQLQNLILKCLNAQDQVDKYSSELNQLEEEFHSSMPDICPLCGQKISK